MVLFFSGFNKCFIDILAIAEIIEIILCCGIWLTEVYNTVAAALKGYCVTAFGYIAFLHTIKV